MRRFLVVPFFTLALGLSLSSPTWAQEPAPKPARTLTVPEPPGAVVQAQPIAVAANFTTTVEVEMPVSEVLLTGQGGEQMGVQRLGRHIVFLRPGSAFTGKEQPTLTLTTDDGVRYTFPLVGDALEPDSEVRVRRGRSLTEEDVDLASVELLLREPVGQLRKSAFQERQRKAIANGVTMKVWGALPLARLSIVGLRIESEAAAPFLFQRARFHSPMGRLRVLGARPQPDGDVAILVQRPADEADGVLYTLSVSEKGGSRHLVADVIPWPSVPVLPARSVSGEEFRPEEGPKADPDVRSGNGKLPRTKVRQRR
jgi:hypothetical protein